MDSQQKTDAILKKAKEQINNLILSKKSGKINITLEINMTQGAIGTAFISKSTRGEGINFNDLI